MPTDLSITPKRKIAATVTGNLLPTFSILFSKQILTVFVDSVFSDLKIWRMGITLFILLFFDESDFNASFYRVGPFGYIEANPPIYPGTVPLLFLFSPILSLCYFHIDIALSLMN